MDFEQYARRYGTALLRLAVVLTADPAAAEDAVQEVLLRAYARWPRISRLDQPHAYVRRMVVNEVTSWRRRIARVEVRPEHLLDRPVADPTARVDSYESLLALVSRLPPKQRAAVVLRYFEDLTDEQIAETLACRTTTVRGYIHRALRTLRVSASDDRLDSSDRHPERSLSC